MPERHDASACTKTPIATASLPKTLLLLKLRMKQLLVLKADTFREAFLNDTKSSTGLEVHLSRSKFPNLLLSLFFHYSLKSYLPFIITFPYSFHLAHYVALVWLHSSYAIWRGKEIPGWYLHPWRLSRVTWNLDWPDLVLGTLALQVGAWSQRPSEVPDIQHFYEPMQTETKRGSETWKGRRKPQSHRGSAKYGLQIYSSTILV